MNIILLKNYCPPGMSRTRKEGTEIEVSYKLGAQLIDEGIAIPKNVIKTITIETAIKENKSEKQIIKHKKYGNFKSDFNK